MPISFRDDESDISAFAGLGLFAKSTFQGAGEVFGFDPTPDVERFRAEHPLAGTVGELAGFALPYGAWFKTGTKIPQLAKAIERAGDLSKSKFVSGALKDITLFAPFEAGRTVIGATLGDSSLEEMLKDNALSLAIGGGAAGAIESLVKRPKVLESIAGFVDEAKPVQLQLREISDRLKLGQLPPEEMNALNYGAAQLRKFVREESPLSKPITNEFGEIKGRSQIFVRNLGDDAQTRTVNSLFKKGGTLTGLDAEVESILQSANIPSQFEQYVRFPRFVELPKKRPQANKILKKVAFGLKQVGDNTWLAREAEDGLYVVAKRAQGEKNGVVLFKTDSPDLFAPAEARWTNALDRITAWQKEQDALLGQNKFLDLAMMPLRTASGTKMPEAAKNEALNALYKTADKLFTPRMFQLRNSALGRAAMMSTQVVFDAADQMVRRLAYGERAIDPGKSVLAQVVVGDLQQTGRSVLGILREAEKAGDMPTISKILDEQLEPDKVAELFRKGELSAAGKEFFDYTTVAHNELDSHILPLQKITGVSKYKPLKGHWGIPRTRPGDHRIRILNEKGDTIELVGGETTAEVNAVADRVIALAQEQGRRLAKSDPFLKDTKLDTELLEEYGRFESKGADRLMARRLASRAVREFATSQSFRARQNVPGYVKDWDADTLAEVWAKHATTKARYAASLAARQALGQYVDKLRIVSGTHALDVVLRRLDDFEGKPGPISRTVNESVDRVLGPILGKNSATKIASATNKFVMHMSLGAFNIAYPVINAVGYLQTVLPHVALVKNAPPRLLSRYYDSVIAQADNGVQGLATLSPLKIMIEATKQLNSKEPAWIEALARAANDGTMDPRFIEEYVGQHAEKFAAFRKNASDPRTWPGAIRDVSLLVMESGERFSRAHAFATGYLIAKEFMFRDPDKIYKFARRFTDNTMYRYSTPDRATLFAGPVGTTFGLFKNWMMHYMMNTIQYAGLAASKPTSLAAWSPLLWQIAGTSVVGGVGAWPFFSLMDGFSSFVSDKPIMEHLYSAMNEDVADGIYYGVPGLLGYSLSAQAQMPFHAPLRDAEFMFTPVILDRILALGQAIGNSVDRFSSTGYFNPLDQDRLTLNWAKALAPRTVYRALQAQSDDAIRSGRTGAPLVKDVGTLDRIAFALGLPSTEIDRTFETAEYLWGRMDERNTRIQQLGQEWKEAQLRGDYQAVEAVLRRTIGLGIDPSRVVKSAQKRLEREEVDMLEYQFSPEEIWRVQAMSGQ